MNTEQQKRGKRMATYTFRLPSTLLTQAKRKAGLVPLGKVVRLLVVKWLKGEIELTYEDDEETEERG